MDKDTKPFNQINCLSSKGYFAQIQGDWPEMKYELTQCIYDSNYRDKLIRKFRLLD